MLRVYHMNKFHPSMCCLLVTGIVGRPIMLSRGGKWPSKFPEQNKGFWAVASFPIAGSDQHCGPVKLHSNPSQPAHCPPLQRALQSAAAPNGMAADRNFK